MDRLTELYEKLHTFRYDVMFTPNIDQEAVWEVIADIEFEIGEIENHLIKQRG